MTHLQFDYVALLSTKAYDTVVLLQDDSKAPMSMQELFTFASYINMGRRLRRVAIALGPTCGPIEAWRYVPREAANANLS